MVPTTRKSTTVESAVSTKSKPIYSLRPYFNRRCPASLFDLLKDHVNLQAAYDSAEREAEQASICQEGTRDQVMNDVIAWAEKENGRPVCWLRGPAGAGKSTIAHTIAQRYDERKMLGFSFFFSRRNRDRSDATKLFATFAYQLAVKLPQVKNAMEDALAKDPLILQQRSQQQFTKLIINPVRSITEPVRGLIIVIDGLDECGDREHIKEVIRLFVDATRELPFRMLFTSRPEAYIESMFAIPSISSCVERVALQDFNAVRDVYKYLCLELSRVQIARELPSSWPSEDDLQQLAEKAENIFIYASTLVKFVDDDEGDPCQKLKIALQAHKGLDSLFEQVLHDAARYPHFARVLGGIVFLRGNPNISSLPALLQLNSVGDVQLALRGCWSILLVPKGHDGYVRPYHASLLDFLNDPNRRRDLFFDPVECNGVIIKGCIDLITANWADRVTLRYACHNFFYHIQMFFLAAKNSHHAQLNLGPETKDFLKNVLQWFKQWVIALEGHQRANDVREDLVSAIVCAKVGPAILDIMVSKLHISIRNYQFPS